MFPFLSVTWLMTSMKSIPHRPFCVALEASRNPATALPPNPDSSISLVL